MWGGLACHPRSIVPSFQGWGSSSACSCVYIYVLCILCGLVRWVSFLAILYTCFHVLTVAADLLMPILQCTSTFVPIILQKQAQETITHTCTNVYSLQIRYYSGCVHVNMVHSSGDLLCFLDKSVCLIPVFD